MPADGQVGIFLQNCQPKSQQPGAGVKQDTHWPLLRLIDGHYRIVIVGIFWYVGCISCGTAKEIFSSPCNFQMTEVPFFKVFVRPLADLIEIFLDFKYIISDVRVLRSVLAS